MSMTPETDLPEDGLGPDGFGLDGDAKLQLNGMSQPSQPGVFFGPGPPIQTTKTGHGPFGCNLFVFHIPNDMTNMDLYSLFIPFGNVISVRIMIEKETGRSRGFGFVSYDNRPAAEFAIKSMNGFQLGHKRLKVQHKNEKLDKPEFRSVGQRMNWGGAAPGGPGGRDDDWQRGQPYMPPLAQPAASDGHFAPNQAHAQNAAPLPQMSRPLHSPVSIAATHAPEANPSELQGLAQAFEAHMSLRTTAMVTPTTAATGPLRAMPSMATGAMHAAPLAPSDGPHLPRCEAGRPILSEEGQPAFSVPETAPVRTAAAPAVVVDAQVVTTGGDSWESPPLGGQSSPLNLPSNQLEEPDYDALLSSVLSDLAGGGSVRADSAM